MMRASFTRRLTPNEHDVGFVVCPCGTRAHVMRAEVVRRLPAGYSGEICPECNLWVCSIEKLREVGYEIPQENV